MTSTCDDALLKLFSALDRSLIQYLDQADPWIDVRHAEASHLLHRLATGQRQSSAELADLLSRRRLLPQGAACPSEFTRLHYVSLHFAMDRLIANQIGVIAAASGCLPACVRDPSARALHQVHNRETGHLAELRRLRDLLRGTTDSAPTQRPAPTL